MKKILFLFALTFISCGSYNVMHEKGEIQLGMTSDEVLNIWGKPTMTVEYETALNGNVTAYMYSQMMKATSQIVHIKNDTVVNFMYEKDSKQNNWQ